MIEGTRVQRIAGRAPKKSFIFRDRNKKIPNYPK